MRVILLLLIATLAGCAEEGELPEYSEPNQPGKDGKFTYPESKAPSYKPEEAIAAGNDTISSQSRDPPPPECPKPCLGYERTTFIECDAYKYCITGMWRNTLVKPLQVSEVTLTARLDGKIIYKETQDWTMDAGCVEGSSKRPFLIEWDLSGDRLRIDDVNFEFHAMTVSECPNIQGLTWEVVQQFNTSAGGQEIDVIFTNEGPFTYLWPRLGCGFVDTNAIMTWVDYSRPTVPRMAPGESMQLTFTMPPGGQFSHNTTYGGHHFFATPYKP